MAAANTQFPQPRTHLLSMPKTVRERIYDFAIPCGSQYDFFKHGAPSLPVARVCRLFRDEILPIWLSQNEWLLHRDNLIRALEKFHNLIKISPVYADNINIWVRGQVTLFRPKPATTIKCPGTYDDRYCATEINIRARPGKWTARFKRPNRQCKRQCDRAHGLVLLARILQHGARWGPMPIFDAFDHDIAECVDRISESHYHRMSTVLNKAIDQPPWMMIQMMGLVANDLATFVSPRGNIRHPAISSRTGVRPKGLLNLSNELLLKIAKETMRPYLLEYRWPVETYTFVPDVFRARKGLMSPFRACSRLFACALRDLIKTQTGYLNFDRSEFDMMPERNHPTSILARGFKKEFRSLLPDVRRPSLILETPRVRLLRSPSSWTPISETQVLRHLRHLEISISIAKLQIGCPWQLYDPASLLVVLSRVAALAPQLKSLHVQLSHGNIIAATDLREILWVFRDPGPLPIVLRELAYSRRLPQHFRIERLQDLFFKCAQLRMRDAAELGYHLERVVKAVRRIGVAKTSISLFRSTDIACDIDMKKSSALSVAMSLMNDPLEWQSALEVGCEVKEVYKGKVTPIAAASSVSTAEGIKDNKSKVPGVPDASNAVADEVPDQAARNEHCALP